MTLAQANACIEAYLKVSIKLVDVELRHAMAVVNKVRAYAYDAYMLVCAQQFGSPILTLDEALKAHAESLGIQVLEV